MDTFNRNLEKSLAGDDQPHTYVVSAFYELPFGPRKKWLVDRNLAANLLGNWRIGCSLRYYSGQPLGLISGQALPLFGGGNRPIRVESVPLKGFSGKFDPATDRWINPEAFVDPAPFTFGTISRTLPSFRGPGFANENITITKLMTPREGHTGEIYAAFLNAFNRTVFSQPVGNTSSKSFGMISSQSNDPRQIELGFRYRF